MKKKKYLKKSILTIELIEKENLKGKKTIMMTLTKKSIGNE
jgi:hypothetical protein